MLRRLMLLSLLVCGGIFAAQDVPHHRVAFDDLAFTFSEQIATGVQITPVEAGVNVSPFAMFPAPSPAHTLFTFLDYIPSDAEDIDRDKFHAPEIRVYRLDDLMSGALGDATYSAEYDLLALLLDERPALSEQPHLPFLPLVPGIQTLHARQRYIETDSMAGIAYLTHRADRAGIILEGRVFYTFQGISRDGQCYIAAWLPVDSGVLPIVFNYKADVDAIMEYYDLYIDARVAALEGQPSEAYYPPLGALDALFESVELCA